MFNMKLNMQNFLCLYGTVCKQGWLGYNGNWYMLYAYHVLNFSDAGELFILHKAKHAIVFWF